MNYERPYSPVSHAPAIARTQLDTPCRYARYAEPHPVPSLKGLWETRTASVSYRALAPVEDGLPSGMEGRHSDAAQPTANYSLLTANSTTAPPVPPVPLIQHSALDLHVLRQRKGPRDRPILLRLTLLQQRFECVAERGSDGFEISVAFALYVLRGQPSEVGGSEWGGDCFRDYLQERCKRE